MASCWRRANSISGGAQPTQSHLLYVAWVNTRDMCEISDLDDQMVYLDWFAKCVDDYAVDHMIADDKQLGSMLKEWRDLMPCDPTVMAGNINNRLD